MHDVFRLGLAADALVRAERQQHVCRAFALAKKAKMRVILAQGQLNVWPLPQERAQPPPEKSVFNLVTLDGNGPVIESQYSHFY